MLCKKRLLVLVGVNFEQLSSAKLSEKSQT